MAADDLSAPLGQHKAPKGRRALPIAVPRAIVGRAGAVRRGLRRLGDAGGRPLRRRADGGRGGRPAHRQRRPQGRGRQRPPVGARRARASQPLRRAAGGRSRPPIPPGAKTVTIIDGISGKRQEIVLPGPADKDNKSARHRPALARELAPRRAAEDRPGRRPPVRGLRPPGQGDRRQAEGSARRDRDRRPRHRRRRHERSARQAAAGR